MPISEGSRIGWSLVCRCKAIICRVWASSPLARIGMAITTRFHIPPALASRRGNATPASAAKYGYDAMRRAELRAINDGKLRFMLNWLIPFMPRWSVLKMVRGMQTK